MNTSTPFASAPVTVSRSPHARVAITLPSAPQIRSRSAAIRYVPGSNMNRH
jgi:hypothetical protein